MWKLLILEDFCEVNYKGGKNPSLNHNHVQVIYHQLVVTLCLCLGSGQMAMYLRRTYHAALCCADESKKC